MDLDADWELVTVRDLENKATSHVRFMRLLVAVDSDDDGLPDDWEMAVFGSLTAQSGWDDFDIDGLSNLMEWQHGTDPKDYYNGNRPLGVPAAPSAVSVRINLSGGMDVTWNDNSDNETGFVISEHHYDGTVTALGSTTLNAASYHITSIAAGSIGVSAFNPEGISPEAMEELPGASEAAPRQPALYVNRLNRNKVRLSWITSGSEDPGATDRVHIYRSVDDGAWVDMTQFAPVPVAPAQWDDTAAPDHRYQYTIVIERHFSGPGGTLPGSLASYAALPASDYYLDVEIQFTSVSGDPFPLGELTGYGFIPDTWTADSIPPASVASWTLAGSSLRKKGVLKWEQEPWSTSGICGTIGGEWDSATAMAAFPLAVDWHGTNLLAPDLFAVQPWRIEAAVGNGHSDIQTFYLSHERSVWFGETYALPSFQYIEIPKGFDETALPNALMIPSGSSNEVYYSDPSNYLPGGTNATVSIAPGASFSTDPVGPVDTSNMRSFALTISGGGSAAGSILTASRATANTRKLALVPMPSLPLPKTVAVYNVQLVNGAGVPPVDSQGRP